MTQSMNMIFINSSLYRKHTRFPVHTHTHIIIKYLVMEHTHTHDIKFESKNMYELKEITKPA